MNYISRAWYGGQYAALKLQRLFPVLFDHCPINVEVKPEHASRVHKIIAHRKTSPVTEIHQREGKVDENDTGAAVAARKTKDLIEMPVGLRYAHCPNTAGLLPVELDRPNN